MPSDDRRDAKIQQRLEERRFGETAVVELMDDMTTDVLEYKFGPPTMTTLYAEPQGYWQQGDPRPPLADDDPAVMQAIGRCAAFRGRSPEGYRPKGGVHPAACGWCSYPLKELLAACDWATWASRYMLSEYVTWWGYEGSTYSREVRSREYENPRWRDFWASSVYDREERIGKAQAA